MTQTHKYIFLVLLAIVLGFYAMSWLWRKYTLSHMTIDSQDYKALSPWIDRLQDSLTRIDSALLSYIKEKKDLNTATAFQLRYVKGIGKVLSQRIIQYRESLGGFSTLTQLQEIKGLHATLQKRLSQRYHIIHPPESLHVNQLSDSVLCDHPYVDSLVCKQILALRPFHSTEDFQERVKLSDTLFHHLKPYLSF